MAVSERSQDRSKGRLRAEALAIVDVLGEWADDPPAKSATGEVTARVVDDDVAVTAAFDGEKVVLTTAVTEGGSPEREVLSRYTAALVAAAWDYSPTANQ